jgi:DNA polymerase III delta prime subunit
MMSELEGYTMLKLTCECQTQDSFAGMCDSCRKEMEDWIDNQILLKDEDLRLMAEMENEDEQEKIS